MKKSFHLFFLLLALNLTQINSLNKLPLKNEFPAVLPTSKKCNILNKYVLNDEFSTNILKQQILNELRSSEEVIKNIIFKIINHFYEFIKYRFLKSFYNLYIINPFDIQIGNLLNTQLNNYYLTHKLKIPTNSTPLTFGMPYEDVKINDTNNNWLVKSRNKNTNKAFVLMYGWFGNPQSTLPFLNILNQLGVLEEYHVLILNLYDNSNIFENNVGVKGMVKLYNAMRFLHTNFNVTNFSVYTQSVSSISVVLLHNYLKKHNQSHGLDNSEGVENGELDELEPDHDFVNNVTIDRIVLESPVLNIKQYLLNYKYYNNIINNNKYFLNFNEYINKLNVCKYLRSDVDLLRKVNILQGMQDEITTMKMLRDEFATLKRLPGLFLFPNSGHIDLASSEPKDYFNAVKYLLDNSIIRFFKFNKNKVKRL